jgi:hypothetical protein
MTYFLYPGETLVGATPGIDYWEASVRADKNINESIRVAGGFAYSRTCLIPVPGAGMQPLVWVTTFRSGYSQWISACRSPALLAILGSAINLLS